MGNSDDKNDKTQALSESQVLEIRPSHAKVKQDDKNDRSVWKGLVVGADEFAPPPPPPRSRSRWVVLGILGAAAIGGGAYVLWPKSAAAPATPDAAKKPDAAPTPDAAAKPDAAPPDAAVDAPLADAPADAAADAGVDAAVKPVVKKKPATTKKKPVKKKVPSTSR